LVLGEEEMPWGALAMMFQYYGFLRWNDNDEQAKPAEKTSKLIHDSTAWTLWSRQAYRSNDQKLAPLYDLLYDFRSLECEDYHDNVYALIGFADDGPFDTDYSICKTELFSRVFTKLLGGEALNSSRMNWRENAESCRLKVPNGPVAEALLELRAGPEVTPITLKSITWNIVTGLMPASDFQVGAEAILRFLPSQPSEENGSRHWARHELFGNRGAIRDSLKGVSRHEELVASDSHPSASSSIAIQLSDVSNTIDTENINALTGPKLLDVCGAHNGPFDSLMITSAQAAPGDQLCKLADECFLLLRHIGYDLKIVGPAWNIGELSSLPKILTLMKKYNVTTLGGVWEDVVTNWYKNRFNYRNFCQNVELHLNILELFQVLLINESLKSTSGQRWGTGRVPQSLGRRWDEKTTQ
jgi:hypothetical protein